MMHRTPSSPESGHTRRPRTTLTGLLATAGLFVVGLVAFAFPTAAVGLLTVLVSVLVVREFANR